MNHSISYMRVTAMLFIVFYHCLCYYGIWDEQFPNAVAYDGIEYWRSACYVALNTFVFMSGFLFAYLYIEKGKYRDSETFYCSKAKRLLLPYIFWGVIAAILFSVEHPFTEFFCGIQHLWFLLMLFGVFVTVRLNISKWLKLSILRQGGVITALLLINQLVTKYLSVQNYFCWLQVLKYLPAFLVGMMLSQHQWSERINKLSTNTVYGFFALSFALNIAMAATPVIPFKMFYIIISTFAFLIFLYAILNRYSLHSNIIIQSLDKCSLGIYILHHLLIWSMLMYIPSTHTFMNQHYIVAPVLLFAAVFSSSWISVIIFRKFKITRVLIGA